MRRKPPKATAALAKMVWKSQRRPSARSVARAMSAAGYDVHYVTVARWKRNDWKSNSNDNHALDVARTKLEAIAPLATQDPILAAAEESDEQLSDAALLRQESRKLSALSIRVWGAAEPQLEKLVRRGTGELALLIEALAASSQAAMNALMQAEKIENGPPLAGTGSSPLPG